MCSKIQVLKFSMPTKPFYLPIVYIPFKKSIITSAMLSAWIKAAFMLNRVLIIFGLNLVPSLSTEHCRNHSKPQKIKPFNIRISCIVISTLIHVMHTVKCWFRVHAFLARERKDCAKVRSIHITVKNYQLHLPQSYLALLKHFLSTHYYSIF